MQSMRSSPRATYGDVFSQVGLTLEKNLRWLLEVYATPPQTLDADAVARRKYEIDAFASLGDFSPKWIRAMVRNTLPPKPPDVDVDRFQSTVTTAVDDVLTQHRAKIPLWIASGEVLVTPDGFTPPWRMFHPVAGTATGMQPPFTYGLRLLEVLTRCAWRLARCKECNTIFLKKRHGQQYCQNRHRTKHFMRALRDRPAEATM